MCPKWASLPHPALSPSQDQERHSRTRGEAVAPVEGDHQGDARGQAGGRCLPGQPARGLGRYNPRRQRQRGAQRTIIFSRRQQIQDAAEEMQ